MKERLHNINVLSSDLLPTPEEIKESLPLPPAAEEFVYRSRGHVQRILDRTDPRMFVVVGPCSIHDRRARSMPRLRAQRVEPTMLLLMRVYFEKPRTTIGWKGLINDPDMDDSFHIEKGIRLARELLLFLADIGMPAATEALIRSAAVPVGVAMWHDGARTTERRRTARGERARRRFQEWHGRPPAVINAIAVGATSAPLGITQWPVRGFRTRNGAATRREAAVAARTTTR
jgi:3-deoxy-7-phosphoheptulonate synthase